MDEFPFEIHAKAFYPHITFSVFDYLPLTSVIFIRTKMYLSDARSQVIIVIGWKLNCT